MSTQAITEISFREFLPGDEAAFRDLNEQWINKYFTLEDADLKTLREPFKYVLAPGGHIYFAQLGEETVGCCALISNGDGSYEVSKMAVKEEHRNKGIGKSLLFRVIQEARKLGIRKLTLFSNSMLTNAVHIYETLGFYHVDPASLGQSHYGRSDVFMEMEL